MTSLFRIKICGVTNQRDAAAIAQAGADAIGLNFYSASPRCVSNQSAKQIVAELPQNVQRVGVFVNASIAEVNETAADVGLDFVQLHGDETAEQICLIRAVPVIKAIRSRAASAGEIERLRDVPLAGVLLDAFVSGEYGGTGARTDWPAAAEFRNILTIPMILAGGLNYQNVAAAIRTVSPHSVDVASGVELAPGQKCGESVQRFVVAARQAFEEDRPSPRR